MLYSLTCTGLPCVVRLRHVVDYMTEFNIQETMPDDFEVYVDDLIRDVQTGAIPIDLAVAELETFLGADLAYAILEQDRY